MEKIAKTHRYGKRKEKETDKEPEGLADKKDGSWLLDIFYDNYFR